ncbi:hypothetical protein [Acidisoma sp. L85]|uniref:hypothetical protein n=1 Tax=Acidisoma sp. L85 TaxID=1641850 RepID=UPI00131C767B|nr:hypothetical protein [Acidisoma sp. L85]
MAQTINQTQSIGRIAAIPSKAAAVGHAANSFQNHLLTANTKQASVAGLAAGHSSATPSPPRRAAASSPKPNSTSLPNAGGVPGIGVNGIGGMMPGMGMGGLPGTGMGVNGIGGVGMMPGMGGLPGMGMGMNGIGGMGMMPGMGGLPGMGMGMNGIGGMGMNGMGMGMMPGMGFNPQAMILGPLFQRAGQLDVLLAAGKISPREFGRRALQLFFQMRAATFQIKHPWVSFAAFARLALFGSNMGKKGADPDAEEPAAPGVAANRSKPRASPAIRD